MAAGHGSDITETYPTGYLKNIATGRYHTISFRPAPMPGNADANLEAKRYKSIGHHAEGFDTRELAEQWVRERESLIDFGLVWEWEGIGIPAMIEFFSKAQLKK